MTQDEQKTPRQTQTSAAQARRARARRRLMDRAVTHCLKAMTADKMTEAPLKEVVAALGTLMELEGSEESGGRRDDVSASEILQALKTFSNSNPNSAEKLRTDDDAAH